MPNVHKKGKRQFGLWLSEEERAALEQLAQQEGLSLAELIKKQIVDEAKKRGIITCESEKK